MPRPKILADLNEAAAYDTILSINPSQALIENPGLLIPAAQIVETVQNGSRSEGVRMRKQGDTVEIMVVKKGREAQIALEHEQDRWDRSKEQYYRIIEGKEPFTKDEYRIARWTLNQWASKENLPQIEQEVYDAAKVVEGPAEEA